MRAAVLSGIAGRELEFLKLLTPGGVRSGVEGLEPLLLDVGRSLGGSVNPGTLVQITQTVMAHGSDVLLAGFAEGVRARKLPFSLDAARAANLAVDAANAALPEHQRRAAISLLSLAGFEQSGEVLLTLAVKEKNPALHTAVCRGLAGFQRAGSVGVLLKKDAWALFTPMQRENLLSALLDRSANLPEFLDAIERGALPAGAIPAVRRGAFLKHADVGIRARAEKVFAAATGDRQKAFDDAKAALALKADAKHGREVFKNTCAICHRLDREGSAVGPDLLDMRNQPKESILFHIVVPDAEIAPAFTAYIAETKDGRSLAGILASETPTAITLRGPLAQETSLLRSEIKKLEALQNSLMPAGLDAAMTRRDLADLLGYLKGED